MVKHVKALIYAEVGTGKSVFAGNATFPGNSPKDVFFITTDGNYEFLEGLVPNFDEANHKQVFSWEEAKKVIGDGTLTPYKTVVIDLLEDLYRFAEDDFLKKNNLQDMSDLGYGKSYSIVRRDFSVTINKLLALEKNIILLCHAKTEEVKDRRGVSYTKYSPSSRLPDKVLDEVAGRCRYVLRAFALTEEDSSQHLVTNRYLSLSPDGIQEYGILRGVLEKGTLPRYIPLDWSTFINVLNEHTPNTSSVTPVQTAASGPVVKPTPTLKVDVPVVEVKEEPSSLEQLVPQEEVVEEPVVSAPVVEQVVEPVVQTPTPASQPTPVKTAPVEPTPAPVTQSTATQGGTQSSADKLAAIRAKLAAMKSNK